MILGNAPQDNTADVLRQHVAQLVAAHPATIDLSIHVNQTNVGHAAGHNHGLRAALAHPHPYVLTVNPDVVLAPDYAQRAIGSQWLVRIVCRDVVPVSCVPICNNWGPLAI